MIFILLINVKMPTIVGILTFISKINIISESYFHHFTFYEQLRYVLMVELCMKKVYNLRARAAADDGLYNIFFLILQVIHLVFRRMGFQVLV